MRDDHACQVLVEGTATTDVPELELWTCATRGSYEKSGNRRSSEKPMCMPQSSMIL